MINNISEVILHDIIKIVRIHSHGDNSFSVTQSKNICAVFHRVFFGV